ncbi:MAG: glycosyltransferase family 2 protein [Caldilineaceae bacterium]|nr:glycosyltransferase family 2 protein [Caldilineaceae bacterium]
MLVVSIVVTHNGSKWIDRCLTSLMSQGGNHKILVVDNASVDDTLNIVKRFQEVECIPLDRNLGFGVANNIGMRRALEMGADYVLLLNQDAWLAPDTIDVLLKITSEEPGYGIVSPLHWSAGGNKLDDKFLAYVTNGAPDMVADLLQGKTRTIYDVPFVAAAVWLISRSCIEQTGGFDPLFFMYREDDDYCRRVLWHGFRIGIAPRANAYHERNVGRQRYGLWQGIKRQSNWLRSVFIFDLKAMDRSLARNILTVVGKTAVFAFQALVSRDVTGLVAVWPAAFSSVARVRTIAQHRKMCLNPGIIWL